MDKNEIIERFFYGLNDEDKEEWLTSRKNCDASLFYFIKEMGGFLRGKDGQSVAGGDSIEYLWRPICDFWQDDSIKRKFVYMPRRWLKSTNRKWGQIHSYLQNNELRILTASEVEKRVKEWIKWQGEQILNHARLRWVYPELLVIDKSYKHANPFSSIQVLLPRKGIYDAVTFAGVGIHGSSQGGHYDIIEPDDVCGEKAMDSVVILEDAFRWFDNVESLLTDVDKDIIRGVGTHWLIGDFGEYVQTEYPEYKWIIVPALKDVELEDTENIRYVQDPEAENGESNWDERGSTKYYIDMAANPQTQIRFWTQEQNNPRKSSATLNKFDLDWLRYYHFEEKENGRYIVCDDDGKLFRVAEIPMYGIIDPGGFAETRMIKKGSNNAILIGGQPRESIKKFVVFADAAKMKEPSQFRDKVFSAHKEFSPRCWRIEVFGQQGYILKDIQEEKKKQSFTLNIWECPKDVGRDAKDLRIQGLIPPMANAEIYIHKNMKRLITEISRYPGGLTVDLLDCLGWLNQLYWSRKTKASIDEINRRREQSSFGQGKSPVTGY